MNIVSLRSLKLLVLLLVIWPSQQCDKASANQQPDKNGTLIVLVTWGDDNDTPANDVYAEARGFVREYNSEKSFVLKSSTPGRYEASLPPGIYDVFIREDISEPRCKRMQIIQGRPTTWTLKLEFDEVYRKGERV
jgi:hypothetical protein